MVVIRRHVVIVIRTMRLSCGVLKRNTRGMMWPGQCSINYRVILLIMMMTAVVYIRPVCLLFCVITISVGLGVDMRVGVVINIRGVN